MFWTLALRSAGLWLILSLVEGQLTEQEQAIILDTHNELRGRVEPSAAFMQKLVWDEGLRLVAEGYASKCLWRHNPELENLQMGENLFVSTGPFDATKAVMDWFEENEDYDYENNTCPEDKMCGHYTQVVWADSQKIGCASHVCNTLEGIDFEKATLLVCDYYPAGNYDGEKPYVSGAPCSKCPENLPVCENNICVAENLFPPSEEPDDDTEGPTVLPEHPHTTTEPSIPPGETDTSMNPSALPDETHTKMEPSAFTDEILYYEYVVIEDRESTKASHGSEIGVSAPLMLVWLLAALVL